MGITNKLTMLFGAVMMCEVVSSLPITEVITIEYGTPCYSADLFSNCTTCKSIVKVVQKELEEGDKIIGPLLNLITMICHKLYGPTAKQCYDIASNATSVINYITHHNTTFLCKQMDMC